MAIISSITTIYNTLLSLACKATMKLFGACVTSGQVREDFVNSEYELCQLDHPWLLIGLFVSAIAGTGTNQYVEYTAEQN